MPPIKISNGTVAFDQALPKTESCPLNGAMYSQQQREWWEKHRPLGVMIENHPESRPQSGLSSADVLYEAVAEGGITRFLSVFYCQDAGIIGPVRSARTYFLDFISEYGQYPLYAHVGGAHCNEETGTGCANGAKADALGQIEEYGWGSYNDISEFSVGCPIFCRDESRNGKLVATEHTMYSSTKKLWDFAKEKRDLTNVDKEGEQWDKEFVSYSFKDDAPLSSRPEKQSMHVEFWTSMDITFVDWQYDKATNTYKRSVGGAPHMDKNTNKQMATKNVVVLIMQESHANDGYEDNAHLLYKNKGTGKAVVLQDGQRINGTWRKDSRTARTLLFDQDGKPIKFNKGLLWFQVLPTDGVLKVS